MKTGRIHATLTAGLFLALSATAQETTPTDTAQPASAEAATIRPFSITPAPDPLSSAAAVYATYQGDVTELEQNEFDDVDSIQTALTDLGSQNAEQLSRGWIAYSALVASQNPEFRAAVRDIEGYYGRDALVRGLQNDVRYARNLHGGSTAVSAALNAGAADAQRLQSTAELVKEQAYSLQAFGWAKGRLGDSGAIATKLRADSLVGRTASNDMTTAFRAPDFGSVLSSAGRTGAPSVWRSVSNAAGQIRGVNISTGLSDGTRRRVAPGSEQVADKIATLAAYRVLGGEGGAAAPVQSAMSESQTTGCINMAQLNLQQCIAATHQHFEVPFCLGEHALAEIGSCIAKVSN
ncbi:hypothetical protein [Henriciella marina]|uniref:hypothetical protein n=1 Tax=Henriciella marina TaxID=453851 RepID=UPI00037145B9|nr:hypothetical protein [Henriciella marina]